MSISTRNGMAYQVALAKSGPDWCRKTLRLIFIYRIFRYVVGYPLKRVHHTFLHTEYPGKRSGADAKTYGAYLTTRNQRSVLVGDSKTLVLSSSICSLTRGSKKRRPSPKRTGTMPIWISSTSPARRHC